MAKRLFVFGSNEAGMHLGGAAKAAMSKGAVFGHSYGQAGDTWAIPTMDLDLRVMPMARIQQYVTGFLAYAEGHPKLNFQVTRIGCGIAGYSDKQIAPMFVGAPLNCQFDEQWRIHLGDTYKYWGTV